MVRERAFNQVFVSLASPVAGWVLGAFSLASFCAGVGFNNMNIFASSGALLTVFGLISLSRDTTGKKIEAPNIHVYDRLGINHPAMHARLRDKGGAMRRAKKEVVTEVETEVRGLIFAVVGTLIWAYGGFLPDLYTFGF